MEAGTETVSFRLMGFGFMWIGASRSLMVDSGDPPPCLVDLIRAVFDVTVRSDVPAPVIVERVAQRLAQVVTDLRIITARDDARDR
jgi:hypothetical protein